MCHPKRTYLDVLRFFFGKMSRLTLYLKMRVYHMIIHVFGKVQGPTSSDHYSCVIFCFNIHSEGPAKITT